MVVSKLVCVNPVQLTADQSGPAREMVNKLFISQAERVVLNSGEEAVEVLEPEEIEVQLSWRSGNLIFRGESLATAVSEVGRYTSVEFVIQDEALRRRVRVAGLFKTGDVSGFLSSLEANFDIVYERADDETVVLSAADESPSGCRRISKLRSFVSIDWRISFGRSSYSVAGRRLVARASTAFWAICARFRLVYLTIGLCAASHAQASDTLTFDIAKARADLALIAFAEQADRTLLFSFDETQDKTANRVSGQYEVVEALELLLAGTGLSISMGTQGQLSVVEDGDSNGETVVKKPKSILARIGMALTGAVVGSARFAQESNETGLRTHGSEYPRLRKSSSRLNVASNQSWRCPLPSPWLADRR